MMNSMPINTSTVLLMSIAFPSPIWIMIKYTKKLIRGINHFTISINFILVLPSLRRSDIIHEITCNIPRSIGIPNRANSFEAYLSGVLFMSKCTAICSGNMS